jgi:peptidylamidoglycolate lyase
MQASRFAPIGLLLFCAACTTTTSGEQASAPAVASTQEIAGTTAKPGEKGGEDATGPYELVPNWPDPTMCGAGYQQGSVSGVWAETPDRIFVFQRGCLPVLPATGGRGGPPSLAPARNASGYSLSAPKENWPRWDHVLFVVNREGKLIESWDQWSKLFVRTHRVVISPYDPERNVWIIDDGAHSIYKFTHDGKKLLLTLGEFKVPGNDEKHFGRPTDIAFLPDGTFFVSDGYTNGRVVKFDKDGKFLMTWGQLGNREGGKNETRPGYFNTVHGIAIDNQRRVYVDDRSNNRIQIFDENGKFIEEWPNMMNPYYIYMSNDQHLWVSGGTTQKIMKYDLTGRLLYGWGSYGVQPGGFWGVHQFSVDSENNLFTADVHVGRLQKFRPKPGVDPRMLVGQRVVAGSSTN